MFPFGLSLAALGPLGGLSTRNLGPSGCLAGHPSRLPEPALAIPTPGAPNPLNGFRESLPSTVRPMLGRQSIRTRSVIRAGRVGMQIVPGARKTDFATPESVEEGAGGPLLPHQRPISHAMHFTDAVGARYIITQPSETRTSRNTAHQPPKATHLNPAPRPNPAAETSATAADVPSAAAPAPLTPCLPTSPPPRR